MVIKYEIEASKFNYLSQWLYSSAQCDAFCDLILLGRYNFANNFFRNEIIKLTCFTNICDLISYLIIP